MPFPDYIENIAQGEAPVNPNLVNSLVPSFSQGRNVSSGAVNYFNTLSPEDQRAIIAGMNPQYNVGNIHLSGQEALNRQLSDWYRNAVNAGTVPGLGANSLPTMLHTATPEQREAAMSAYNWTAPQPPQTQNPGVISGTLNAFTGGGGGGNAGGSVPGAQPIPGVSQPAAAPAEQPYDYKAAQERQKKQQEQRAQWTANRQNPPQM